MKNKIVAFLLLLIFINCRSEKIDINDEYRNYQIAKGLDPSIKRPFQHFKDFLTYQDSIKKQNLINSPSLKVNQVYVHYRTNNSVEFSVYSDEGTFCVSTFDLDMNGKILSLPDNGIVKVIKPIRVEDFGDFEITNNFIKTRKRSKTPFREWYDYVNGTIKKDTIHFTEKYIGTNRYKFKKKWLTKTRKTDLKEIYQPNLKATKYKDRYNIVYFMIAGEFNVK
jgi:hypothetical protein